MIYLKATSMFHPGMVGVMTLPRAIRFSLSVEKYSHSRLVKKAGWKWSLTFEKPTVV